MGIAGVCWMFMAHLRHLLKCQVLVSRYWQFARAMWWIETDKSAQSIIYSDSAAALFGTGHEVLSDLEIWCCIQNGENGLCYWILIAALTQP